jgi:hypothetical protein
MDDPRKLRCYQYVNRDYESVRDLVRQRPMDLFQGATRSAVERANVVATSLRAGIPGIEVGVDVRIHVNGIREEEGIAGLSPVTRVAFSWEAARAAAFFPVMKAELSFWRLTATETQLEIDCAYQPPLGVVGTTIDVAVGHRVAEATVHRFLDDIVAQLQRELPATK